MTSTELTSPLWDEIRSQRSVRIRTATESFNWFFHLYLSDYVQYPTADFQREMMALASDPTISQFVVMAFRESGKSTMLTTAFPLWAVVGKLRKKYVLIVSQTQNQAQQHLANIARELDLNDLIRKDFWPYNYEENELGITAINLTKFDSRIIAVSKEQGVRGLRNGPYRPDLIVADDVEDSRTVAQQEARDKNFAWFTGELLPLGTDTTKIVVVGNQIHDDSLINRLKRSIEADERDGIYREYPLESDGIPLWPGRFPDKASVERLKRRIADPIRFQREYQLKIVPDIGQVLDYPDFQYYSKLPPLLRGESGRIRISIDPAVSKSTKSDKTAIVICDVRGSGQNLRIYVQPNPINKRLNSTETVEVLNQINTQYTVKPRIYVENNGYQQALVDWLKYYGNDAVGITSTSDKLVRLNLAADKIRRGTVLFPEKGCEELISQVVHFGENRDDLVDSLTMAILAIVEESPNYPSAIIMCNPYNREKKYRNARERLSADMDRWDDDES